MSAETKNYELAYLLSPSLIQEDLLSYVQKLTTLIEESKGIIRKVAGPKKRLLSYPIKKRENASFGWTTFSMAPEFITGLEKKLKAQENILRHLLVEEEEFEARPFMLRTIPTRLQTFRTQTVPRAPEKTEEKLDLEALDKKLEEILGK